MTLFGYNVCMILDEECKDCLYNSQMKKVEKDQNDESKLALFKAGVKSLCANPPADYCAPLLMRDINSLHCKIFGRGIDYSREKRLFNCALCTLEDRLYGKIISSREPLREALKYSMAANYIDFARLSDLKEDAVQRVVSAAEEVFVDGEVYASFKEKLARARKLCFLHDNCGEIVLDKILIRVIKKLYKHIKVVSIVRGGAIINDVTVEDAAQIKLYDFAEVVSNGTDVPGTYLKEASPEVINLLKSDVVISKGLGNLETLYGSGYGIFYAFTCKCAHIAKRFGAPLWSSVFTGEKSI